MQREHDDFALAKIWNLNGIFNGKDILFWCNNVYAVWTWVLYIQAYLQPSHCYLRKNYNVVGKHVSFLTGLVLNEETKYSVMHIKAYMEEVV